MISLGVTDNKIRRLITAGLIALAVTLPVAIFAAASAATITERSIALSSSSVDATNVTYQVNFTSGADAAAGAFVVDFCSDSSVIGQSCTAPTGLDVSSASSTTSGFTDVSALDANTLVVTGTIATETAISVELDGITNPDTAAPVYARIVTYVADTDADLYTSDNIGSNSVDSGSVAIFITDTIGVSAAVLESMTFCVSGDTITADCGSTTAPTVELGETVGSTVALVPGTLSTGQVYTQITTNASAGAIVSLKSSAAGCGGLLRSGAPLECDITPALTGDILTGDAEFGVLVAASADTGTDPQGTFQVVSGSGYNDSTYALNYAGDELTGVTSPFGDPFLDTDGAPANNKNMVLTFGAQINNNTPAGLYSADMSLIATGKF